MAEPVLGAQGPRGRSSSGNCRWPLALSPEAWPDQAHTVTGDSALPAAVAVRGTCIQ